MHQSHATVFMLLTLSLTSSLNFFQNNGQQLPWRISPNLSVTTSTLTKNIHLHPHRVAWNPVLPYMSRDFKEHGGTRLFSYCSVYVTSINSLLIYNVVKECFSLSVYLVVTKCEWTERVRVSPFSHMSHHHGERAKTNRLFLTEVN